MAKFVVTEEVQKLIDEGYLNVQKHPTADLWLYNYSKTCQIDKVWNDITCLCRGLIVDGSGNIVARPFKKFFNYEEIIDKSVIPDLPFKIYEKLDGSLGILYWIDDKPHITTKGSFISEQGQHAEKILYSRYSQYFDELDRTKTYLFEIIWNEDHHCINYGDLDDIFLLAIIDTDTGEEEDIYKWEHIFKCTKLYPNVKDWRVIRELYDGTNREGFVIKFSNNYRVKMKYESYFRIHFLRCMLSEKYVLDFLMNDEEDKLRETLGYLDEENQITGLKILEKLKNMYKNLEDECRAFLDNLDSTLPKLEQIKLIDKQPNKGILFQMFKNCPYTQIIWKTVKKQLKQHD